MIITEMPGLALDSTSGTSADLLSGKTLYNGDGDIVNGGMTDNGAVSKSLNCGESYTVPTGYHSGSGKVTANSLASQTVATATAEQVLSGYTAWVNGALLSGSLSPIKKSTIYFDSYASTLVLPEAAGYDNVIYVNPHSGTHYSAHTHLVVHFTLNGTIYSYCIYYSYRDSGTYYYTVDYDSSTGTFAHSYATYGFSGETAIYFYW